MLDRVGLTDPLSRSEDEIEGVESREVELGREVRLRCANR